jgi:hypothetical protein
MPQGKAEEIMRAANPRGNKLLVLGDVSALRGQRPLLHTGDLIAALLNVKGKEPAGKACSLHSATFQSRRQEPVDFTGIESVIFHLL